MIDLSSDTATRPCAAMRQAIAQAEVGDEQRLEDPTVLKLIERTCQLLNKPAGLFLPTGTMCNVVAIKTHTNPGEAVFLGDRSHVLRCETGSAAVVSGVVMDTVAAERGAFGRPELEAALYQPSHYSAVPSLVCVEQTHNFGGGAVWPLRKLLEVRAVTLERDLQVHMDGARLLNAVVASGVSAATYADTADSVWIDFTKGLGAPLGAVLCGQSDFIERARRYKHMLGGAMRQAGLAAAGCLYSLEHNLDRLAEDHRRAAELASFLASLPGVKVEPVDTNLIFFRVQERDSEELMLAMEQRGLRMGAVGESIRAATHLDISDQDIVKAKAVLSELL